jgi:hypothetical protein
MARAIDSLSDSLKVYATDRQVQLIEAVNKHGSMRAAARALGVNYTVVYDGVRCAKERAAAKGWSPEHDLIKPAAPGFRIKGHSTAYDHRQPGAPAMIQWVKTERNAEEQERALREFVTWLCQDAKGLAPVTAPPAHADSDLLAVYPLGDPHFGLYSWARETGEDFDLPEAERLTCAAIDRLVAAAPPAETGLLINLGDFFHADDSRNQTPGHGHALDVDTRYAKVLQVGLRAVVYCVKALLNKHARVLFWMMPGNHDPHSSFALALCIDAFFASEPRVHVDLAPGMFKYHEHGRVLVGAHHGHTAKGANLPGIMATDQAEAWGRTKHRYWYCGHVHHKSVDKEHPGVIVETFRTLAAKDAWHAGQGYRSGRDASLIVLHREHGEIQRTRCDVGMLGNY